MAERIDNRLLYQILKSLQARVTMLEAMLGEIRDGFEIPPSSDNDTWLEPAVIKLLSFSGRRTATDRTNERGEPKPAPPS